VFWRTPNDNCIDTTVNKIGN